MSPLLVQIHRYLGLATLAFLAIAAATGVLLVFSEDLDVWLNPQLHHASSACSRPETPQLVAAVQRQRPDVEVTAAPLLATPGRTLQLKVAAWPGSPASAADELFVDPCTARIVGARQDRPGWDRAHLMRGVYFLHFTLLASSPGRWFMGVAAMAWAVSNLVGFYLTLPKGRPFWRRWKPFWTVNLRARWPRLLLDLHRASGLWLFAGVMVLSLTSVALNFYSEAFAPVVTALSPPKPAPWDRPPPKPDARHRPDLTFAQAERLGLAAARHDRLHLRAAVVTYDAERRLFGVRFTSDGREQYAGLGPISYYFDDATGRLIYVDNPLTDSMGEKALRSLYPLHSGQVAGLATRWLDVLLGLSILEMCVTGVIVWWRKRKPRIAAKLARKRAAAA